MRFLLLISVLFACQTSSSVALRRTYSIKQEGILIEKRYIDSINRTTCIVTYDIETKQPIDSINLNYIDDKGNLSFIKVYNFADDKYELNELKIVHNIYRKAYGNDSFCDVSLILKNKFLIEEVISNICAIQSSILPNGKEVALLGITTRKADITEIKYSGVQAKFNSLPEIFQSYFYNQIMEGFNLQIKNGYLQEEEYSFTDGTFTRTFFYDAGKLIKSVMNVKYKNGSTKSITRTYETE